MAEGKRKKIVVFGANGGIGQNVAREIAEQMIKHKHDDVDVILIARELKKAQGVAAEVLETFPDAPVNLQKTFRAENQFQWDQDKPELLEAALTGADVIINAAGAPRKPNPDGSIPNRAALIGQNAPTAQPIAEAIGEYAPPSAVVVNIMNPADSIGTEMDEIIRRTWDAKGIEKHRRPEHKVLTMGGTLDESRFRTMIAKDLNAKLVAAGKPDDVIAANIEAHVFGQHGPAMVFDDESTRIRLPDESRVTLEEFTQRNGIKMPDLAGIKKKVETAGLDLNKLLGRSAQTSPARRAAEITMALTHDYGKGYPLTASVVSEWSPDSAPVSSGARVLVSTDGVKIDPEWIESLERKPELKKALAVSAKNTADAQLTYKAQSIVPPTVPGADITPPSGQKEAVIRDVTPPLLVAKG